MTDLRKAAEMALEDICGAKLCEVNSMSSRAEMLRLMDKAAEALRQALTQPEQEPVAWMGVDSFGNVTKFRTNEFGGGIPLYTAPPKPGYVTEVVAMHENGTYTTKRTLIQQRKWVGLTDEEMIELGKAYYTKPGDLMFAVEAKLKEKNI